VTTTSTWVSLYRAAFRLKPTSGAFSELDLKIPRFVKVLLAFYGRASVASAINNNICTAFTVILAIQHSHIFVGETSQNASSKRLSINRFVVETSVLQRDHVVKFENQRYIHQRSFWLEIDWKVKIKLEKPVAENRPELETVISIHNTAYQKWTVGY